MGKIAVLRAPAPPAPAPSDDELQSLLGRWRSMRRKRGPRRATADEREQFRAQLHDASLRIERAIAEMPAKTIGGLLVKLRLLEALSVEVEYGDLMPNAMMLIGGMLKDAERLLAR